MNSVRIKCCIERYKMCTTMDRKKKMYTLNQRKGKKNEELEECRRTRR